MKVRYGLVTPVKDESENLVSLFKSIEAQLIKPAIWLIVENGSSDNSFELINDLVQKSVLKDSIELIRYVLPNDKYGLGWKYSSVVGHGFDLLESLGYFDKLDFIGILDADCFPNEVYFKTLISFFEENVSLGITSGFGYLMDGSYDGENSNWVRGNCRLWRIECFLECGYIKGPSADSLSLAKAVAKGWKAFPCKTASYKCREMGRKVNYRYYGYSAYYRGVPLIRILMKSVKLAVKLRIIEAWKYLTEYLYHYLRGADKVNDVDILRYFGSFRMHR
jgi:glycosyltransferase involved in cell wall biosynthesis